jgi:beta-N-acetylhexosaminidase
MLRNLTLTFLNIAVLISVGFAQNPLDTPDRKQQEQWVDSVFNSMTEQERIGQLFMVAAYSNRDETHYTEIERLIQEYHIGGLIFFQGGPVRQAQLTNRYQASSKVPLFIAMDAEWGLGMRLDSTISFPRQMTLGAIQDKQLIYDMGAEIARHSKRLGVHINFAPVVDVNSNPANPVIGSRSFGENKYNVAEKGIAYMKGMQDNGVIANAKHFPGHGDTGTDSHLTLPVIRHDKKRMEEVELYPFKRLMEENLMSVMVAHIHVPAYDDEPNKATTLSEYVVTDLLQKEMGFEGLIFTDALNMKGVSKFYEPGEVDVMALQAGNDVLLFPEDVPEAVKRIEKALRRKDLKRKDLYKSVKKILAAKYWAGLNNYQPIETKNLVKDLNSSKSQMLKQKLYEKALTVVNNQNDLIPIRILDTTNFASLVINGDEDHTFEEMLSKYAPFNHYQILRDENTTEVYQKMLQKLQRYDLIVVGMQGMSNSGSKNFGLEKSSIDFLKKLQEKTQVIVTVFGNAYSLKNFEGFNHIICTYQDDPASRKIVPQLIFGAIDANGKLPVTASEQFKAATGINTSRLGRLGYTFPEAEGMRSEKLDEIDRIIQETIKDQATPGCQILVARNGNVIFEKGYGYMTYDSIKEINTHTIYDLASITKVTATLQAIMFLEERGVVDLDAQISEYLPELKGTNKEKLILRDILTHESGLKAYIPFWRYTMDLETGLDSALYSNFAADQYPNQLAFDLFGSASLQDSVWKWTVESDLRDKKGDKYDYRYSDMGFYMLEKVASRMLNQPMDEFLEQNFYAPLGMTTTGYHPLCKFPLYSIAPTEVDNYFRKSAIHGMVHDPGAAMYGGVAGHAGLFSNANDLAKLFQMNLQDGEYAQSRYLLSGTVPKFAARQSEENRRGLGWDKPDITMDDGPTSREVSAATFGHTGFTGTAAWVDPEFNLVYIFLSNRIYPDAGNWKLIRNSIRTKVQDIIYEAIAETEHEPEESIIVE